MPPFSRELVELAQVESPHRRSHALQDRV